MLSFCIFYFAQIIFHHFVQFFFTQNYATCATNSTLPSSLARCWPKYAAAWHNIDVYPLSPRIIQFPCLRFLPPPPPASARALLPLHIAKPFRTLARAIIALAKSSLSLNPVPRISRKIVGARHVLLHSCWCSEMQLQLIMHARGKIHTYSGYYSMLNVRLLDTCHAELA